MIKRIFGFVLAGGLLAAATGSFADTGRTEFFKQKLGDVPKPELPASAAEMVKSAKASERESTTIGVVKAGVGLHQAASAAIVGAIARAEPDMAATAAGSAAAEHPKLAVAIARAAAMSAPSKAGKIVVAACRAVPNEYRNIAVAVAQVVPGAGTEILDAVGTALPGFRNDIQRVLAGIGGAAPSVAAVLDRARSNSTATRDPKHPETPLATDTFARGPAIGPPYIPLSGTVTNTVPGNSGDVPPGGRNYAAP